MATGRVQKSLRVEASTAERVEALRVDGESEAKAYNRVLAAGLEALEGGGSEATGEGAEAATTKALAAALDVLTEQLARKDEQIATLSRLTDQAQQLHGISETRALESAEGKTRRGLWGRLFG